MTVSTAPTPLSYDGNGSTTAFPITWKYNAKSHVVATLRSTTGTETTWMLTTNYTLTDPGDTGTLTAVVAPATGETLVITLEPPNTQSSALPLGGQFPSSTVEAGLDLAAQRDAKVEALFNRALRVPRSDERTGSMLELPIESERAGNFLAFDANGDPIASSGSSSSGSPVSVYMETLLDDATAAEARSTLGVPSNSEAVLDAIIDAKGDLIVGTAADTPAVLTVGSNGTIPMARSAATPGLAYVAALNKYIYGLTYSNNGSDATNDLDISAGGAMDATGAYWITGSALTKRSDAAWSVGTGAGALDTGAVGNSDYYIWAIARSDTGVVDYLFSLSSTSPTMPSNYDFKRLIGWFKRSGGAIIAFHTYETEGGGLELKWDVPTLDVNLANTLTTSRRTDAVKVPLNFSVIADLNVVVTDAADNAFVNICCPDQTDAAPSNTTAPLSNVANPANTNNGVANLRVRTSATGTIAARGTVATQDNYCVVTNGFYWARRN